MSKKNLSSVAASVIDSYGNTARNMISVYRVGGERVVGFVDQRFEAVVGSGTAGLRGNLIDTQQRFSGVYVKGLHYGSERATRVVDAAVDLAHEGARRIAANAERFDQATQLGALEAISRAALPAAAALSQVAERIESGSSKLVQRVSRQPSVARAAAKQAKAAAGQAKAVKQAAAKSAGKAADEAAARTTAAKKTVARRAKAVVAAAVEAAAS